MINLIKMSWTKDTAYPKCQEGWKNNHSSTGQCAVTALLIQELMGGDIVVNKRLNHYFNVVDGITIDLTKDQFPSQTIEIDGVVERDTLLANKNTRDRFVGLRMNLQHLISQSVMSDCRLHQED